MSRRSIVKKRYPFPDSQYNSCLVNLLSARILKKGKKRIADSLVFETFSFIKEKTLNELDHHSNPGSFSVCDEIKDVPTKSPNGRPVQKPSRY